MIEFEYSYYRTYFAEKAKDDYKMYITEEAVTLEYRDGRMFDACMVPKVLFPKARKLTPQQINKIHRFIKTTDYKLGRWFSKKVMREMYKHFKKESKGK